jgi:hypothetical protein
VLQDRNRIAAVMKDGQFFRELDPAHAKKMAMAS